MIGDWIYDNLGWVFAITLAVVIGFLVFAIKSDMDAEDRFMRQCMQDKKEYECTAMWRAGDSHTTVVPMPVVVGGR